MLRLHSREAEAASGEADEPDQPAKPPRSRRKKLLLALLIAVGVFILLAAAFVTWAWTLPMPKPHPAPQATLVYGADSKVIGQFSEQYRVDVPLSRVPQVVIDAVVSTEDRHFWSEGGIDPLSIARAGIHDLSGGGLQGGSTITQQYVKQAYLSPKRTITRKAEEAVIAFRLNQSQPKKKILDEYLNTIYWGRGAYGVEAASRAFFGKDVNQLNLQEAALLAGIIKNPGGADPAHDPALARRYQSDSLKAMVRDHKITQAQATAALAVPFSSYVVAPASSASGKAGTPGAGSGSDYFLDVVRSQLYQAYGRQMVDGGGLRVYTTLDPTLQAQAYNSIYGTSPHALNPTKGDPSGAAVTVDDQGHVLVLVGGQDYRKSSVDLAMGAEGGGTGRQAGSTFKAFMLAAAIQEGYSVQSVLPSPPQIVIPDGNGSAPWTVTNYDGEALAPTMNLVDATAYSINTVYAQVVQKLGADKLDAMAEALGIPKSAFPHPYLSQVLGTAPVSPLEMAAAYSTFASGGTYHSPIFITKVTNASGKVMPPPVKATTHPVLTPGQAAVESYVLQQVVQHGTGVAAGGIGVPVAGKTGTTENSADAWFIGYTPNVTTAVWMGYADSERPMKSFRGIGGVTGGTIPAELWHDYMAGAIKSEPQLGGQFLPPGDLGGKNLNTAGNSTLTPPQTNPGPTTVPPTTTAAAPTTLLTPTTTTPPKRSPKPAPAPSPTTTSPPVTQPPPSPTTTAPPPTTVAPAPTTTAPSGAAASGTSSGGGTSPG
ncbi:MAG TPA: transglycosylase domain-containing protein [Acidimicrobiales bacterium]|nr:transglycosylase domain-containing protein [Acidimicrobiales bacterium]